MPKPGTDPEFGARTSVRRVVRVMPRTARLRIPGLPLHVVQRGHNRERCFFDRAEFELYLGLLGEFGREHECRIHAYVLMPNHVHLLLSQQDPWAITRLM